MQLEAKRLDLQLATPLRIAYGTLYQTYNVVTRIHDGDLVGIGEAAPSPIYGESQESVLACLDDFARQIGDDPFALETGLDAFDHTFLGNPAAKAAVDIALHDLLGKRSGLPIFRLFGLSADRTPLTSLTIGLDSPEIMAQKAQAARAFPVLKVKLGTDHDLEIIRAIREVSGATIRVFADESCVTVADIPRLADCVDGINIKLMKCGGLRQALEMIHVARAHGLQIMLGCMVESAIAITAAAHLSPLVDYADLDGNLMIEADPYTGVRVANGKLILPDTPGLGITEQEHISEDL